MNAQSTSLVQRKPPVGGQLHQSKSLRPEITPMLFQRVVASLVAGYSEKNIAEAEGISERMVRRIRQLELDRRERQMNAVGVAFGGFLEAVKLLHREIDDGIFEELREGAA